MDLVSSFIHHDEPSPLGRPGAATLGIRRLFARRFTYLTCRRDTQALKARLRFF